MLEGTAFIAIVTAVITSTFVARASRESEAARMKDELSDRELIEKRFDELERKLDLLAAGREQPGGLIASGGDRVRRGSRRRSEARSFALCCGVPGGTEQRRALDVRRGADELDALDGRKPELEEWAEELPGVRDRASDDEAARAEGKKPRSEELAEVVAEPLEQLHCGVVALAGGRRQLRDTLEARRVPGEQAAGRDHVLDGELG